jgi:putative thioredoxin
MDAKPVVFEVEIPSFQSDVVERSKEVPVVLLFWTDQVAPAADIKRHLETLASQYQGKFALALNDVAKDPQLAQQLRVQGIPEHSGRG